MSDTAGTKFGTRLQNFLDNAGIGRFPWKTATILYTISWGWLFLAGNINSLDEPLYSRTGLFENFGYAPWMASADFVNFFYPFNGTIIFTSFFVISVCLFGLIEKSNLLTLPDLNAFAILLLVLPFNTARVSTMTFQYTFSLLVFVIAWQLLIHINLKLLKILSLVLFFLSFATHSLILFYAVPLCHHFLYKGGTNKILGVLPWLRKNIILFLPPLLYVWLRMLLWTDASNYHDVTAKKLLNGFKFTSLFLAVWCIYLICNRSVRFRGLLGVKTILIGLFASSFGSLAYLIWGFYQPDISFFRTFVITFVGRSAWLSRHQLLQAFGFALILVGFVQLVSVLSTGVAKFLKVSAIGFCVFFSVCFGFEYVVDSQKQDRIIDALNESLENKSDLDETRNFVFIDQVANLNARGRLYKFSTYSIWLHQAKYRGERKNLLTNFAPWNVGDVCNSTKDGTLVLIRGPETHWDALKNWVSDGDMGFKVTVDDTPGACKPEMVTSEKVSGAIPILFYFTGARG